MSIFSRIIANFESFANQTIDNFEDPKANLDYSLLKLEQSRAQVSRSLVEVSAAQYRLEGQDRQLTESINRFQDQAQRAMAAGREDLARTALERRFEAQRRQNELRINLGKLSDQVETLKDSQVALERKIALFRSRKEELKALYEASRAQLYLQESLTGISSDLTEAFMTMQRAEARIREMQSRAEAIQGLVNQGVLVEVLSPESDDIDRELENIDRQKLVGEEFARLKAG